MQNTSTKFILQMGMKMNRQTAGNTQKGESLIVKHKFPKDFYIFLVMKNVRS